MRERVRRSGDEAGGEHVLRDLEGRTELEACVELQETIWGPGFSERVPPSLLGVAQRTGGVVAGAFGPSGTLDAFVFGITGWVDGAPLHWSDMLGVRPGIRDAGLGTRLKWYQRRRCLEMEVERMVWTFDPLEARNGWVNLEKLGAVARRYVRNMYGEGESPLHRGLGTDRLLAEWDLRSDRVGGRVPGSARLRRPDRGEPSDLPRAFPVVEGAGPARPGRRDAHPPLPVRVPIPLEIQAVKAEAPAVARAWREAVRGALEGLLARGGVVSGMIRTPGEAVAELRVTVEGGGDGPGAP